nr:MAG TPA: hypothetical protein [Caudoviricetes sp.]
MQYWQRLKNSRKNSEKMRNLKKVMNLSPYSIIVR